MNIKKISVCLVSPLPPPYGGISNWTQIISNYASKSPDVHITVFDVAPRWRAIHCDSLVLRVVGGGMQLLRDVVRLIRLLNYNHFDVLHFSSSANLGVLRDFAFSFLVKFYGIKFVYHIHMGRVPYIAKVNSIEWQMMLKVMRRAAKVIVLDERTCSTIKKFSSHVSVVTIPNCLSIDDVTNEVVDSSEDFKTLLFVGWVIPTKGVAELVEAWSMLKPYGWRLKIIGPVDKDYQQYLLERFQPKNIDFVGELDHSKAMLSIASCDLFVLPSHTEGFPYVILEAMSLGRPIVATDVGAIPEMLADDAGVLVKSKDSEALAGALSSVINDDMFRKRIGENALHKAKSLYSLDEVFKSYKLVWKAVDNLDNNCIEVD
jgi:glycosyltransferase involved in cell wall biosynthesis